MYVSILAISPMSF